jgi:cell division protein FtsN
MSAHRSYEDDDDLNPRGYVDRRADPNRPDREISLGTPTILGIFFLLALVCAGFFGFGYSMGHKSAQAAQLALPPAETVVPEVTSASVNAAKPSAGSVVAPPVAPAQAVQTATVPLNPPTGSKAPVAPSDRIVAGDRAPVVRVPPAASTPPQAAAYMVQVAAVSTQEVADIEIAALKKQGFDVVVRHMPQDKLMHIQIGPFADRKAADAMAGRVQSAGFNAYIVK